MTRQPHDQFAKQLLEGLLEPYGTVEISREIAGEARQIDLSFIPILPPENLGLLGKIASSYCLLEPFRNPPTKTEIRSCLLKLFSLQSELQRRAKRQEKEISEVELPKLWIIASSISTPLLESFGAKLDIENWPQGVYFLADAFNTGIIAINQLPTTPETLLLRLLGKGKPQQQAISEIRQLPIDNILRQNVLQLITIWRISIEAQATITPDNTELLMQFSQAYIEWRENTLQEGIQQGSLQGQRLLLENILLTRFGSLDEELSSIIEGLLQLPPAEYSRLILQLSREELLARFRLN